MKLPEMPLARCQTVAADMPTCRNLSVLQKWGYRQLRRWQDLWFPRWRLFVQETVYHIDSITKNLTAAALVQLAEQHKLNLDDLVEKYVPEIHSIAPAATVRSLMNHTSGIPDFTNLGPKSENIEAINFTHQQFLATIEGERPLFPPAKLWRYNNSGFYLLGMIIEKVSGETYASYMLNRIFKPLGMDSTRYCDARSIVKAATSRKWERL